MSKNIKNNTNNGNNKKTNTQETEYGNSEDLNFDKWLYDQKLDSVFRFEQRNMQLIGLVGIVFALLSPVLSDMTIIIPSYRGMVLTIFSGLTVFSFISLLYSYMKMAEPRTFKEGFQPTAVKKYSKEQFERMINELNQTLKYKTGKMLDAKKSFIVNLVSLLLLAVLILFW